MPFTILNFIKAFIASHNVKFLSLGTLDLHFSKNKIRINGEIFKKNDSAALCVIDKQDKWDGGSFKNHELVSVHSTL